MAKKTYADRLGQYLSMLQGNDVEEYFNSERTAKAEFHKMLEVIKYWRNPYFYYVTLEKDNHTPEELDWAWGWIENNTGARREELEPLYEELLNLNGNNERGIMEKGRLKTDCCSVKNSKIYQEVPHYSIYRESFNREKGYHVEFGKYTAYCQQRTNTSKQRIIDSYYEGIKKMRELYGLYSSEHLPSCFTVYSKNPTEYMYAQVMGLINSILDGTAPAPRLEPCSPKQALWVSKKMGVPEEVAISKLNKMQASELLDVLFNGEENRMLLNTDEVFAHYRAILGINEGIFGKLPIVIEKADNNNMNHSSIQRDIERIRLLTEAATPTAGNHPATNPLLAAVSRLFDSLYQRLYGTPVKPTVNQSSGTSMPNQSSVSGDTQTPQKEGSGKHTVNDLLKSGTASKRGINNTPTPEVQKNLQALLDNVLNPIASKYPTPYKINSGYRCPALNAAVGGAKNSQHMKGQAADITCGSPAANKKLFDWIINQSGINYDQIIDEKGYRWIHISFNSSGCRKKVTHL